MELSEDEQARYLRQITLPGLGVNGQQRLKSARVLVVGAGGLGCPALLYLAGAGIGTIGIVDPDTVDVSNLHRQVLYTGADIGKNKAEQARERLLAMNPLIEVHSFPERLTPENGAQLVSGYDLVLDGTDNFASRYLVNDLCVLMDKPWVYGSVRGFEGQMTFFNQPLPGDTRSGTYRCIFPESPDASEAVNCETEGVLGVLPGMIGTLMASETIKWITGAGTTLAGMLMTVSATDMEFSKWEYTRNPSLWKMPASLEELSRFDYTAYGPGCVPGDSITAETLRNLLKQPRISVHILDIRERTEAPRITGFPVTEIPFRELESISGTLKSQDWNVVICATGIRSRMAVPLLRKWTGNQNWVSLSGGVQDWVSPETAQNNSQH